MNFSTFSIRNPLPAVLFFVVLSLAGMVAFNNIKIQNFPDIDVPTINVAVAVQGAAPSQIESEVTRKIEDAVASIDGIDYIQSTISQGSSTTAVVFKLEKSSLLALSEVRDAVTAIQSELPAAALDPTISQVKASGAAIKTFAIKDSSKDELDLSWFIDNEISKKLMSVTGVSKITREGGVDREIHIEMNPDTLKSLGVTPFQVASQIKVTQIDESGGISKIGGVSQSIRTFSKSTSAKDVENLIISINGAPYALKDIATIKDSWADKSQAAYFNEDPIVAFQIYKAAGSSEVSIEKELNKVLESIKADYPSVTITQVSDSVRKIKENFEFSMQSLYEGAALAVIVVFLFLRNVRATLISAVALPLSILPTFAAMYYWMDISFNGITLLALTLVVGILVDDAIVEVENIVRHLGQGKSPAEAAEEAADEIGTAVIATTFTLVAVFLPTAFMGGIPGKFFYQFGWTIAIAVVSSLLVARLLTPMMCAYLLKAKDAEIDHSPSYIGRKYLSLVNTVLVFPKTTIAIAIALFMGAVHLAGKIPAGFIPASQAGLINLSIELPPGTTFESADSTANKVYSSVKSIPHISSVFRSVGGSSSSGGGMGGVSSPEVRKTSFILTIDPAFSNTQRDIEQQVRAALIKIPAIKFSIGAGGSGEKFQVTLAGEDMSALKTAAKALEQDIRTIPNLGSVSSSINLSNPELVVRPNMPLIASMGITASDINTAIRFYTAGDFDNNASKVNLPERQIPIKVKLPNADLSDIEAINNIGVVTKDGNVVHLRDIAEIKKESNSYQLTRYDRSKNITVSVELNGQPLGQVSSKIKSLSSYANLPKGVSFVESGEGKRMAELFSSFGGAMAFGLIGILVVLILLFKSIKFPLINLAALPLAVSGALASLYLAGQSFSMPALIGMLMLMGVVTKNSVLLIDYVILARDRGMALKESIMDACEKRSRPIIMTTVAMIAGMLPMALGTSGDPSFRVPMAIVVIGGLVTSTVLSLVVIPAIIKVFNK